MDIPRGELQQLLEQQTQKMLDALRTEMSDILRQAGITAEQWMSQNKAYKIYGRSNVHRWIERGWLPVYNDGNNRKRILKADIERCVARNNKERTR